MRLHLTDSAYTERLVSFLRSVGLDPVLEGGALELGETPHEEELVAYLTVWQVLHPDAPVAVSRVAARG